MKWIIANDFRDIQHKKDNIKDDAIKRITLEMIFMALTLMLSFLCYNFELNSKNSFLMLYFLKL